ncbi:MAG TPA: D-alanyl-D-alanine carboxypeptidase family protein [Thermoanaerobaculia bacterium]
MALFAAIALAQPAAAPQPAEDYTNAIVIEPSTWTVLYEKNPDQPAPTASMTKMMTALVVLDLIRNGKAKWSDPVTTSAHASKMGGSQVYLRENEVYPVATMFTAMLVHSANDAAMALAEHFGGERRFVAMMNEKAEKLGLKNTKYHTPHGLPEEQGQPDDASSPRDLARLGWELMKHPDVRRLAKIQTMPFRQGKFLMYNPNNLLERYQWATGIKTGTHDRAGSCITASAEKNGMELIAVFMGAKNRNGLFQTVEEKFEEYFAEYEIAQPVKRGTVLPNPLPVAGGRTPTVPAMAGADLRVLVKSDEKATIGTQVQPTNPPAPVKKGDRVGWLVVTSSGRPAGRVPLLASADVPTQNVFQKVWAAIWPF